MLIKDTTGDFETPLNGILQFLIILKLCVLFWWRDLTVIRSSTMV